MCELGQETRNARARSGDQECANVVRRPCRSEREYGENNCEYVRRDISSNECVCVCAAGMAMSACACARPGWQ